MNHAFSANRQASRKSGTPKRSQSARAPRRFSSETGWPPPELFVIVTITSGTSAARSSKSKRSSAAEVDVPLERVEARRFERLRDREVDRLPRR